MLKKLLIALALLLAVFTAVGFLLPIRYHVERSITVNRPAATVFTLLNGYGTFNEWSPWAERDPDATYAFSGPASGVGARLSWSGDPRQVGTGWQEITQSRPFERIGMHLDFSDQGEADSYFEILDKRPGTLVTWGFDTDVTEGRSFFGALLGRYFGLFFDKWIGADYERGLANFKKFAESLPAADFAAADIRIIDVQPVEILFVSGSSSQDAEAVAEALGSAFGEISAFLAQSETEIASQPMAIIRAWDETGYHFDAALPVDHLPGGLTGRVKAGLSPGGRAARIVHRGPYGQILATYERLAAFMAAHGLEEGAVSWEHYISDPGNTPPEDIITHVYFQIKE